MFTDPILSNLRRDLQLSNEEVDQETISKLRNGFLWCYAPELMVLAKGNFYNIGRSICENKEVKKDF